MKLKNETKYPTRELRKIVTAVHNDLARYEGRLPQWKRLVIEVAYTQVRACSGWAYRGGRLMRIRLQRGGIQRRTVAYIVEHEMMHVYGYGHSEMGGRGRGVRIDLSQFEGTLCEKKPRAKPKPSTTEVQQQRYLRLRERERDWLQKRKRADTYLKKIRRQMRYYERELGKKAALPVDKP